MTKLVGITGGIGAGKSVVSQILRTMGFPVYDCDVRAKVIMDSDTNIHNELCRQISPRVVVDGIIDRRLLSEIVFNDASALQCLNAIVHTAVENDVRHWSDACKSAIAFVESAILYRCRLVNIVDAVVEVSAPTELRIERVIKRSKLTRQEVLSRISSQVFSEKQHPRTYYIINDNTEPILPQLHQILSKL